MIHPARTCLSLIGVAALCLAAAGCPGSKNADLELEAARKAIADAKAHRASDCAKETLATAEALAAEAQALAEKGEPEAAASKAAEAETLASQAQAASPPGCDKPKEAPVEDPSAIKGAGAGNTDASANLALGDILQTVYFDYNEATIREDSKAMLSKAAALLSGDQKLKIEVEGHCDTRGSTEYNLHLGERRAHAVEKYLTTQGARADQIEIISYGEERPIDLEDTENAHQKNRRAEIHKR